MILVILLLHPYAPRGTILRSLCAPRRCPPTTTGCSLVLHYTTKIKRIFEIKNPAYKFYRPALPGFVPSGTWLKMIHPLKPGFYRAKIRIYFELGKYFLIIGIPLYGPGDFFVDIISPSLLLILTYLSSLGFLI